MNLQDFNVLNVDQNHKNYSNKFLTHGKRESRNERQRGYRG